MEENTENKPGQVKQTERESKWFIVRVTVGKEEQIKKGIEAVIDAKNLRPLVNNIQVLTERVVEVKGGKRKESRRVLFKGYVFINCRVDDEGGMPDEVWFAIRETPGVGNFIGLKKPHTLDSDDAKRVEHLLDLAIQEESKPKLKIDFQIGDTVRVKQGTFENQEGKVEKINEQKGLVTVVLTLWNRPTRVQLESWQLEKV